MMTAEVTQALTIGFLLLFPIPTFAAEEVVASRDRIIVRVWDRVHMDAGILDRAKQVTEQLFHPLQIEVHWMDCLTDPSPQNERCSSPAGPNDFSVRIYRRPTEARKRWSRHTAGVAVPSSVNEGSGFIQIFFDRLEEISRDNKRDAPLGLLLGMTIAHEMGHLLLPTDPHSPAGIMQGCLGGRNLHLAARGWMHFTEEQRQTIGKNVRQWSNLSETKRFAALQH